MLEKKTGKRVTELFDWIVGTSTGGIVALGLVYGELLLTCDCLIHRLVNLMLHFTQVKNRLLKFVSSISK